MKDNKKKPLQYGNFSVSLMVESIVPPPPGFTSPFKTLQEWLFDICDNNHSPREIISEYVFGLYESPEDNMICLIGYNTYRNIDTGFSLRRIAFKPSNAFFDLPKDKYGNLSGEMLKKRILKELIEITRTTTFQNSFLSKGVPITTSFGEEIWPG